MNISRIRRSSTCKNIATVFLVNGKNSEWHYIEQKNDGLWYFENPKSVCPKLIQDYMKEIH